MYLGSHNLKDLEQLIVVFGNRMHDQVESARGRRKTPVGGQGGTEVRCKVLIGNIHSTLGPVPSACLVRGSYTIQPEW